MALQDTIKRVTDIGKIVKTELRHIPRGDMYQNELRKKYKALRMNNFFKKEDATKESVLLQAIGGHRGIEKYKFDKKFFDIRTYQ